MNATSLTTLCCIVTIVLCPGRAAKDHPTPLACGWPLAFTQYESLRQPRLAVVQDPLQLAKCAQLIVGPNDISSAVTAMRVDDVDILTMADKPDMTPCPASFTQLVCDNFPILHTLLQAKQVPRVSRGLRLSVTRLRRISASNLCSGLFAESEKEA